MTAPDAVDRRVLEAVEELLSELGGAAQARLVALDDSLDRDLGLGSLERVELLARLEGVFGVRLPDSVLPEAETPRHLAGAIRAGVSEVAVLPRETTRPAGPAVSAPPTTTTLVEALRWHVDCHPDRVHIVLRDGDDTATPITYGELWSRATAFAAGLQERAIRPGQTVGLMLRTEAAFFHAFFGALLAGAVPVPIYPPFRPSRIEEYAQRQAGILRNAETRLLVTFGDAERIARVLRGHAPTLAEVASVERVSMAGHEPSAPLSAGSDPALIQYTSGSTGAPKGVLLSHANLLANIRGFGEAIEIGPGDVAASWLPLYHDMGLIGAWLGSLYFGIPVVVLPPLAFLARPVRWLWAISTHRATMSPAPNFAFDLCVRRIREAELEGLDLSAWRLALNGSEPVSPESIERFTRRFAPYGFKPEAMCPVYGLAESSVALTVPPIHRGPWIDRVDRDHFQRSRGARPAPPSDRNPLRVVSCGQPLRGHDVRIVDAGGQPVPERAEGRVEFRGPSVTSGYFRNPAATGAVLRDGWMESGDLGYQADGELFVTGRQKDLIIKAGRNLYPQEIEEVVGEVPGVRTGCVAAFGVTDPEAGTERLVVIAESRETSPDRIEVVRAAALERAVTMIGVPPDVLVIARPGAVLKTSSGKIRRGATRDAYLGGELSRPRRSAGAQWLRRVLAIITGRLWRFWEPMATLAYAAYVGVLLGVGFPLLWVLGHLAPAGRPVDRIVRRWCRAVLLLSGCPLRVEGLEHLQSAAPAILAANHASYVDVVALLAALPADFRFVAKRELSAAPIVGTIIRKAGHLTVERVDPSQSSVYADRASALLRAGASLLFFPEGTFVRESGLLPFRLGTFKTAVDTRCPVIPLGLRGTRDILPANTRLPRPGPITVAVGPPIPVEGAGWQEMVRLRDITRLAVSRLSGDPLLPASARVTFPLPAREARS